MTVIVFDGNTLAVDRSAVSGGVMHTIDKSARIIGRALVMAGTGDAAKVQLMMKWYLSERDMHGRKIPDEMVGGMTQAELILCHRIHNETRIARYDGSPTPIDHGCVQCAFGEGRDFAYGALEMGASALQAAQIACKYSPYCGGGIDLYRYDLSTEVFLHKHYQETHDEVR